MSETFEQIMKAIFSNVNWIMIVTVALVAPIVEELLFRGVILDGLLKNYSPTKAILWSAVIFGVAHLNPYQFISAFIIGILMGWVYWRTGSLLLCIIIHFINNSFAFVPSWFFDVPLDAMISTQEMIGNDTYYFILLGGSAFATIISIWMIDKIMVKPNFEVLKKYYE